MEHEVQNNKHVLKGMCGNETLKAVQRFASCSYLLSETKRQYDRESNIPSEATSHTHTCTSDDIKEMIDLISTTKPFEHQSGRTLRSFPSISKSPLDQLDVFLLHSWLTQNKNRLARNPYSCDESCEADESDQEEEE